MEKGKIEQNRERYWPMMEKAVAEKNISDALIIIMMCRIEDNGWSSARMCESIQSVIKKLGLYPIENLRLRARGCWGAMKKSHLRQHMEIILREDPANFGRETTYSIKREFREMHTIEDAIKLARKKVAGYRKKRSSKQNESDIKAIISEILDKKTGKVTITIDP